MAALQQISESELEIMQIIWKNDGQILFAPLMEALEHQGKSWKANTVLTFLTRLADKEMLRVKKRGRNNEYFALCTEEEYLEALTQSFVSRVYGGSAKDLVASLLRRESLTRKDMDELQQFWKEANK